MIMAWHKELDWNLMVRMLKYSLFKTGIVKCCNKFRVCHAFPSFSNFKEVGWGGANLEHASPYYLPSSLSFCLISDQIDTWYTSSDIFTSWMVCRKVLGLMSWWQSKPFHRVPLLLCAFICMRFYAMHLIISSFSTS